MTLIANYPTKKACREAIGQRLCYIETSFHGPQFRRDGVLTVAHRPHITGRGREWFGRVTVEDGIIKKVE